MADSNNKAEIINCHTHIIASHHLPNGLFLRPLPIIRIIEIKFLRILLVWFIVFISWLINLLGFNTIGNWINDKSKRVLSVANMLDKNKRGKGNQKQFNIFEYLKGYYTEGTRFVLLSLDTKHMGKGKVPVAYEKQLKELQEIKEEYGDIVYPFVHAEPRRDGVTELVKDCLENRGFRGIKIYPPFGIHPADSRLNAVYEDRKSVV